MLKMESGFEHLILNQKRVCKNSGIRTSKRSPSDCFGRIHYFLAYLCPEQLSTKYLPIYTLLWFSIKVKLLACITLCEFPKVKITTITLFCLINVMLIFNCLLYSGDIVWRVTTCPIITKPTNTTFLATGSRKIKCVTDA